MKFNPRLEVGVDDYTEGQYYVDMEAPDLDIALAELEQLCKQLMAAKLQFSVDSMIRFSPLKIFIKSNILTVERYHEFILTEDMYDKLKKEKQILPERKLDADSLLNDVEYAITMIRSEVPLENMPKNRLALGLIYWLYHIREKHFGVVFPSDIKNIGVKSEQSTL
jgi:hypothetical protein